MTSWQPLFLTLSITIILLFGVEYLVSRWIRRWMETRRQREELRRQGLAASEAGRAQVEREDQVRNLKLGKLKQYWEWAHLMVELGVLALGGLGLWFASQALLSGQAWNDVLWQHQGWGALSPVLVLYGLTKLGSRLARWLRKDHKAEN